MTEKPSAETVVRSLTGFDEIAIEQKFGADFGSLNGTMSARSLAFILHRRDGLDDKAAYQKCMAASLGDIDAMFDSSGAEGNA